MWDSPGLTMGVKLLASETNIVPALIREFSHAIGYCAASLTMSPNCDKHFFSF